MHSNLKIKKIIILSLAMTLLFPFVIKASDNMPIPKKAETRDAVIFLDIEKNLDNIDTMKLKIKVDPKGEAINAVGVTLNFSPKILTVNEINVDHSFCELFIENIYDNSVGAIKISCGKPTPGVSAESEVAEISFDIKKSGWTNFEFSDDTMVLANDGFGTNVLGSMENKKVFVNSQ